MEALRDWLLGVLAASLLTAVALAMMPDGPVRSVGRLLGGLLLFLAVVRPVLGFDYGALRDILAGYSAQLEETGQALAGTQKQITESIIAQGIDAYIQDKTAELALDCQVEVTWDWSGDAPVPAQVTVTGDLTPDERETLTQAFCEDLGLEPEQVVYQER